jgi:hypothetical protein
MPPASAGRWLASPLPSAPPDPDQGNRGNTGGLRAPIFVASRKWGLEQKQACYDQIIDEQLATERRLRNLVAIKRGVILLRGRSAKGFNTDTRSGLCSNQSGLLLQQLSELGQCMKYKYCGLRLPQYDWTLSNF